VDLTQLQTLPMQVENRRSWLRVRATYEADHEYEIVVSYDGFTKRSRFRVTSDVDLDPPAFAGAESIAFQTMQWPVVQPDGSGCSGSCGQSVEGRLSRVALTFAPPPADTALLVFEHVHGDSNEEFVVTAPWSGEARLGYEQACVRLPVVRVDETNCGRLVAYDVAGNKAGESELCSASIACKPALQPGEMCMPADACVPDADVDDQMEDPTASSGCASSRGGGALWAMLSALALWCRRRGRP
jgi:hypothetical protein